MSIFFNGFAQRLLKLWIYGNLKKLMFTAVQYQNQVMGYAAQVEEYYLFYGTCHLKRSHLREVFPQYEFCFVRQVHGSRIVEASSVLQSADGHYTREKNKALIVQTADCLPVLLMKKDLICAVHAGWRGVAQQIVISAVQLYLTAQFFRCRSEHRPSYFPSSFSSQRRCGPPA